MTNVTLIRAPKEMELIRARQIARLAIELGGDDVVSTIATLRRSADAADHALADAMTDRMVGRLQPVPAAQSDEMAAVEATRTRVSQRVRDFIARNRAGRVV